MNDANLESCIQCGEEYRAEESDQVLVFVHGFMTKTRDYEKLCMKLVESVSGETGFVPFEYPAHIFSLAQPRDEARKLSALLNELAEKGKTIILCGHSVGTMLIRQAIINEARDGGQKWFDKIQRVVLLSSTNRGYQITKTFHKLLYLSVHRWIWFVAIGATMLLSPYLQFLTYPILFLLVFSCVNIPHPFAISRRLFVESVLRGSDWSIGLRLAWLDHSQDIPFKIYHVRGEKDTLVERKDNADLFRFSNTRELVLPNVGHHELKLTARSGPKHDKDLARIEKVREEIEQAVIDCLGDSTPVDLKEANPNADVPSKLYTAVDMADQRKKAKSRKMLLFLVHGIRDFGEWQETLGKRAIEFNDELQNDEADKRVIELVPVKYGYFSAFQFIFTMERNRVSKSFLDRYCQARNENPNAEIVVAAHSNGTYVFAKPASNPDLNIRADRVYLAGSVLPRNFKWLDLNKKISSVRNDCAGSDWPVGALCWLLSSLRFLTRVGTGGVYGFHDFDADHQNMGTNNRYIKGGHGAALESDFHDDIARYLVKGGSRDTDQKSQNHLNSPLLIFLRSSFIAGIVVLIALFFWWIPTFDTHQQVMIISTLMTFILIRILMRL